MDYTVKVDQNFVDAVAKLVAAYLNGSSVETATKDAVTDDGQSDPWKLPGKTGSVPPVEPTQQPRKASQGSTGLPTGTFKVSTPNGEQTWTLGAPNAPECTGKDDSHGNLPAAFVVGHKGNKQWKAWRCAYGAGDAIGVDWRDKCNFSVWA